MFNYDEVKANHISNLWFADILHDQEKMKEIGGKQKVYASRHYLKRVFGVEYYDQLIAVMSNIHVLSNVTPEKEEKPEEKEESSEPDTVPEPAKKKPNNGNRSAGKVLQVRGGYQCCGKIFTSKQAKSILGSEFAPKSERVKISDMFECDDRYQKVLNAFKEYVGSGASIS